MDRKALRGQFHKIQLIHHCLFHLQPYSLQPIWIWAGQINCCGEQMVHSRTSQRAWSTQRLTQHIHLPVFPFTNIGSCSAPTTPTTPLSPSLSTWSQLSSTWSQNSLPCTRSVSLTSTRRLRALPSKYHCNLWNINVVDILQWLFSTAFDAYSSSRCRPHSF